MKVTTQLRERGWGVGYGLAMGMYYLLVKNKNIK